MIAQTTGRFSTMLAFFFVALLVVSPFAFVVLRRVRAERSDGRRARSPQSTTPLDPRVPDVLDDPDDLAVVLAAIDDGATSGGPFEFRLPAEPRHDGRPVARPLAREIVEDAIRRSRVRVLGHHTGPDGDQWQCEGSPTRFRE